MDQPGKVANPARGQLNRKNNIPLSLCVPENLVSRNGFSRPVPRQPAHLHTQAESGAYLRDSSRVPRRRPYETAIRHRVSPEFIGTMDQLIFASLSHTHYWYEVGMLKVPAVCIHICTAAFIVHISVYR